jgi:hypothetical protein
VTFCWADFFWLVSLMSPLSSVSITTVVSLGRFLVSVVRVRSEKAALRDARLEVNLVSPNPSATGATPTPQTRASVSPFIEAVVGVPSDAVDTLTEVVKAEESQSSSVESTSTTV